MRGNCSPSTTTAWAKLTNLVAVGNSIPAPSNGAASDGAAIYAGCTPSGGTGGFDLTLNNSTISGNSGPGGIAGIDGEIDDHLTLHNTILHGDTGAGSSELGGFGLSGGTGTISVSHSDVCALGSSRRPYAGAGNICADPRLAGVGSGNVRETVASPTIDRGVNGFLPAGVSTDFYGQRRIVGTRSDLRTADIGAAEWQLGTLRLIRVRTNQAGLVVTLRCLGAAAAPCTGAVTATTVEQLQRSRVVGVVASARRHRRLVVVAHARFRRAAGHVVTLGVRLNRRGAWLLHRFGRLPVRIGVTQAVGARRPITIRRVRLTLRRRRHR